MTDVTEATTQPETADTEQGFVPFDLNDKTIAEIEAMFDDPEAGSALKKAIARYLASLKDPNKVISAFSSFVE